MLKESDIVFVNKPSDLVIHGEKAIVLRVFNRNCSIEFLRPIEEHGYSFKKDIVSKCYLIGDLYYET